MTQIYLAYSPSGEARRTFDSFDWDKYSLNLLVSFYYLDKYRAMTPPMCPGKTILDSGAFSAWKSGCQIFLGDLIDETKRLDKEGSPLWGECVALDVIGDPKATLNNARLMKEDDSPAYPVFHVGEDWGYLKTYCEEFPKVGLSCRLGEGLKDAYKFLDGCFGRCYPHRFHSFGWVAEKMLLRYPFETADSASWNNSPTVYGTWRCAEGLPGPKSRNTPTLAPEIRYYLDLQEKIVGKWKKELVKLEKGS